MAWVRAVSSESAAAASEPGAAAARAAAMDAIAASAKTAVPCPLASKQGLADIAHWMPFNARFQDAWV